ncbi:hypothetical protein Pres01_40100 [Metapseudomonas resinovorans]|uniref:hypothetical protein n=1 Tax=Metapseudomonas resinovorans TaxID=53412 RepID=UPI000984F2C5|nr:hypothetical protein [Pseudomonas resinovorans]GLZ87959.1 hypothetical protein Pres01_40100 [Pseudomonas resinovorans]
MHDQGSQLVTTTPAKLLQGAIVIALLSLATEAAGAADSVSPASAAADDLQRVAIVGGSYFFRPDHVVVKAGRPLELAVRVEAGIIPHRFVLETADGRSLADVPINEKTKVLRFALPAGKYLFQCPNRLLFFKSHRERGMTGVLEVKE